MNCVPGHDWISGLLCSESTFIVGKKWENELSGKNIYLANKVWCPEQYLWTKVSVPTFLRYSVSCSIELSLRNELSAPIHVFSYRQIHKLIAVSYFYTYIVLLTKPSGRSESPFLMKISGYCITHSWTKEFKQQRNLPPVATTRKGLLPSSLPEGALLWAICQLEIKRGPLTVLLLFWILVKIVIRCS